MDLVTPRRLGAVERGIGGVDEIAQHRPGGCRHRNPGAEGQAQVGGKRETDPGDAPAQPFDDVAARFAAAQARGDTTHQKEEARFALAVLGQAERALLLAQANYALQREVADARILLEAALAAHQPAAAAPVLQWMASSGVESVTLQALAARIKALR